MTDPFEAFESNLATATSPPVDMGGFDDPAAEFLAREKAEMDKIENNGGDQFGDDGFGDFGGSISTKQEVINNGFESPNDFFGSTNGENGFSQTNGFSTESIPESKSNTDSAFFEDKKDAENKDLYSAIHTMDQLSVEPEKIKRWREEQKIRLETKDAEEEQKKKDWKEAAKKELDEWYRNRQEQLQKTHENNKGLNKSAEAELVTSKDSNSSTWEKVAKLCEFNPKANKNVRDVGRMRSILLQLKQQPLVR